MRLCKDADLTIALPAGSSPERHRVRHGDPRDEAAQPAVAHLRAAGEQQGAAVRGG